MEGYKIYRHDGSWWWEGWEEPYKNYGSGGFDSAHEAVADLQDYLENWEYGG